MKNYEVALSFAGEQRLLVAAVAENLAAVLGQERVFYDRFHEAELARPNLDVHLQDIYHNQSRLVVVFLGTDYQSKEWCGLEWRAVRDLLKERSSEKIMLIRVDSGKVGGVLGIDGYLDARSRSSAEIADQILERLRAVTGRCEISRVNGGRGAPSSLPDDSEAAPSEPAPGPSQGAAERSSGDCNLPPNARPKTRERIRAIGTLWLLVPLLGAMILEWKQLTEIRQPILAVLAGLLAGFITFFLSGRLGFHLPFLQSAGGLGVFALVIMLWSNFFPEPGLYRVRVAVLDAEGKPLEGATIWSAPVGEKRKIDGGWELDIRAGVLPEDRRVTIYAEHAITSTVAQREIFLRSDFQPTVELRLPRSIVCGVVVDKVGHLVAGVRVNVAGYIAEGVRTGSGGDFAVAAYAAPGEMVRLHAEKVGFRPVDQYHPAGSGAMTIVLERE